MRLSAYVCSTRTHSHAHNNVMDIFKMIVCSNTSHLRICPVTYPVSVTVMYEMADVHSLHSNTDIQTCIPKLKPHTLKSKDVLKGCIYVVKSTYVRNKKKLCRIYDMKLYMCGLIQYRTNSVMN